jgi:hypothetical protein|tara:strand:- start:4562 stop:4855 length:294 start_codon:yes stop_codon:yes gene_type:complete
MSFKYDKDNLFKEFKVATEKDEKNKKNKYGNRIKFCKDHKKLKEDHPEYYEGVDINFANLLVMWSAPNPRDHCYMTVFGKTYAEKQAESEKEFAIGE